MARGRLAGSLSRGPLPLLQILHRFAQRAERLLLRLELACLLRELFLDVGERRRDRRREPLLLALEPLATLRELGEGVRMALATRFAHADRLLALGDTFLQFGDDRLGLADGLVHRGHRGGRRLFVRRRRFARGKRLLERSLGGLALARERALLPRQRSELLRELRRLLRDARLGFARERELLLEPRHLGVGLVIGALLLVERVARCVVVGAQRLLLRFCGTDLRLQAIERDGQGRNRARVPLPRGDGILLLREPLELLDLLQPGLVLAILGRDLRLRVELFELGPEFDPDVLDSREVVARVGEPALRLLPALLVLRDAGGLLEEHAELLGLRLDHARDHPLLDDRVGAGPESGAEEEVVDVAAADRDVVDVVGRIAVARQHALDRQLGVLAPLPADAPGAVVEEQLHRRTAHRLALAGAVEDHVLHRLAAQRRGLRFAEHPPHGVDHVRLAAAIGADDADQLAGCADRGGIDERLEPGELDLGEAQLETA